jgi:HPt (histidine-containing phosphotransfer) domain-containing protein
LRVKKDAASLSAERAVLKRKRSNAALGRVKHIAHALSGAGGIYGFIEISDAATSLEDAVDAELAEHGSAAETDLALDGLVETAIGEDSGDHVTRPASVGAVASGK